MIIRSYSRHTPSFRQLIAYLTCGGRMADLPPLTLNLFAPGIPDPADPPASPGVPDPAFREVADEFLANARLLKPRKNGVILYHEIISFAKADRARATPAMLIDLAWSYLRRRAPGALAFGVVHTDRDNLHVHLIISANFRGRSRRHRLSRAEFARVKRETETLQRTRYPELTHSRVEHGPLPEKERQQRPQAEPPAARRPAHAEHQRQCRLEHEGKHEPSRKEILSEQTLAALIASCSPADFRTRLREPGLDLYERRGRPEGILHVDGAPRSGPKKYRFLNLGLGPAIATARERWQRYPENRRLIGDTYAEKLRRTFRREHGYHQDIADVLRPAAAWPAAPPVEHPSPPERPQGEGREEATADHRDPAATATRPAAGALPRQPEPRGPGTATAPPSSVRAAASLRALFRRKRCHARDDPGGRDRSRTRDDPRGP